jgi:hypothetical protein
MDSNSTQLSNIVNNTVSVSGDIASLNNVSTADINAQCDTAITDANLATSGQIGAPIVSVAVDIASVMTRLGVPATTINDNISNIASTIGAAGAGLTSISSVGSVDDLSATGILSTQMTESYAATGVAPTVEQALFLIQQAIMEGGISGTSGIVRKIDQTTTAATYDLDDADNPTDRTRTS